MVKRRKVVVALAALAALLAGPMAVLAQRNFGGYGRGSRAPIAPNTPYDGRFTFVRLRYGPPIAYQTQAAMWSHDYPTGEQNMMKILNEISYLNPHIQETNILTLADPEIFKYPLVYLCEPGRQWYVTDEEATNFRAYLQKGGFLIVDDFRYYDWDNFEAQMRRILPDVRIFDLDATHPIFHSFFEINSLAEIPNFYDPGAPVFRGIFEDNDPKKRLMVVIGYNTDVSEYWEWSGTGFKAIDESNEAFKVGVNFFMYGMTH